MKAIRPKTKQFQSTLPAWGATNFIGGSFVDSCISIHAPRMGSDSLTDISSHVETYFNPRSPHGERPYIRCADEPAGHISIHAPRMGSDECIVTCLRLHINFNPRSPHGERRSTRNRNRRIDQFQSTLPAWGATSKVLFQPWDLSFQSTLPAWGATAKI